jgi:periplasmic copper chaperone A
MIMKMKTIHIVLCFLSIIAFLTSACAAADVEPLSVSGAWARPAAAGQNSAIYLTISNPNNQVIHLLEASSEAATQTELHQSQMDEQGVMSMHPQHDLAIPRNGQLELSPGGYHIMLVTLKQDLKAGDFVKLVLKFDKSGEMLLQVPIQESP